MAAPQADLSLGSPIVDAQREPLVYDRAWRFSRILYRPSFDYDGVRVLALSTPTDLFLLIEDMPVGTGSQPRTVAFAFDVNHDGGGLPQNDDILFVVAEGGGATALRGDGVQGWVPDQTISGWDAAAGPSQGSEFRWNCEIRIPLDLLRPEGSGTPRVWATGIRVSHNNVRSSGDTFSWPPPAGIVLPDTWGDLLLIGPAGAGDSRVLLDVARITQGSEFDMINRRTYDYIAGKQTWLQARLYAPDGYFLSTARVRVRRIVPPGPVQTLTVDVGASLSNAPNGMLDRGAGNISVRLPGSFFEHPGTYKFEIIPAGSGGAEQPAVPVGTRRYQPTNEFNVLLQPHGLQGVVPDGLPWGPSLTANIPAVMRHMARLMPVRDGALPFRLSPADGPVDAGIRYFFAPFVLQPRPGDTLDTMGPRYYRLANDMLHRVNAVLEIRDPGNTLGRIDRAGALGASTGTGGGQAQSQWTPMTMGMGFDANPDGGSASVMVHEFLHCIGYPHTPTRDVRNVPGRPILNIATGSPIFTPVRTVMFWQVTSVDWMFMEGPTWNAVRQTLVDKPRLPPSPGSASRKDSPAPPAADAHEVFRISGTINQQNEVEVAFSEVRPAEGFEPSSPDIFGDYTVEFQDENGNTLCAFPFSASFEQSDSEDMVCEACGGFHGPPASEEPPAVAFVAGFLHQIPFCEGSTQVSIVHGGTTLWEAPLPDSVPEVNNVIAEVQPNDTIALSWQASDLLLPAVQLRHSVLFVREPGAMPVLVANGLEEQDVILSGELAPPTMEGRFIVETTNGRNTAEGISNIITIEPRPPAIAIVTPDYDDFDLMPTSVIQGVPHRFSASTWDNGDGILDGDSIVWESSEDGLLGTGAEAMLTFQTAGGRAVSATATNSSNLSSQAWVQFSVLADSDGDGLPDQYEMQHACLNMQIADAHLDQDDDGLSSLDEFHLGTDPCNPDTSGNGYADGDTVRLGADPRDGQTVPAATGLFVTPSYLHVAGPADGDALQSERQLTVRIPPPSPLDWFAMTDTPWITLLDEQGSGDGSIGVTFDPELMTLGRNNGLIVVGTADGPPRVVDVEVDLRMEQDTWVIQ